MFSNRIYYFPIITILGFLIFTEILYLVGPIDFKATNTGLMYFFLAICNIALFLGYHRGLKVAPVTFVKISKSSINYLIVIAVFLKLYELQYIWSGHGIPLTINSIVNAVVNPGEAYYSEAPSLSGSGLLRLIVAPFTWASIPIGILYWSKFRRFERSCLIIIIILEIFVWLGIGVRKGLFDVLVVVFFSIIASNAQMLENPKMIRKLVLVSISFVVLFLVYFVFSNMSRGGRDFSDFSQMLLHRQARDFYSSHLPSWLVLSLMTIEDYLCQGYDALNRVIHEGIISPVLFSSNWFTSGLVESVTGQNIINDTYLSILETKFGIDRYVNWHTIYVWLANEYTLFGVPLIMYIIGYFFAETWKDAIWKRNLFAYPILLLFVIMTFYSYANNQVFSSSFTPFCFWFIIYQISKRRLIL